MLFEVIAIGEVDPDTLSTGIQWAIEADYSHLAILVDRKRVFHATEKGFHESSLKDELENGKSVIRHRFTIRFSSPIKAAIAYGWLLGKIGCKYGWLQYVGYIFPFINHLKWIKNHRAETVCSEVVADWLYDCACDFKGSKELEENDFTHPKKVVEFLQTFESKSKNH